MADTYITSTYVKGFIGTGLWDALAGVTGFSWTTQIESATATIQSGLRNSGYAASSTTDDEFVKSAVMGALWEQVSALPEKSIPLPENWDRNPLNIARVQILNGDADLTHSLTKRKAVGGWAWSEHRSGVTDSRTQRASRKQLEDW